ncbi:MAG: YhcH/YjgK/YiaL family protein [Sedimentisphaerales bacterium]
MILDRIENARLYAGLNINFTAEHAKLLAESRFGGAETAEKNYIINPETNARFAKAFEVLTDASLLQKKDGKYTVEGDNLFYTIQRYATKPMSEGKLEAHRKYIDIQFLLSGVEILGYSPLKGLTVAEEYNPEKDIVFFETPKEITKVKLEPGLFCILFPDDAHLPSVYEASPSGGPCCQVDKPAEVRKVVIKIRL